MAPAKDADLEPENWVMPEVLKPDEKELMETITRSARRNTYDNAKKETKGKRMSAREEGDAARRAEKIAAGAAAAQEEGRLLRRRRRRRRRAEEVRQARRPARRVARRRRRRRRRRAGLRRRGRRGAQGPERGASYKIKKVIGEGGFSRVLLVEALGGHEGRPLRRRSSRSHLKLAGDSFIKATMLERDLLAGIAHPFVLGLYHSFQEKDRLVMVVDFCQGGSVHYVNIAVKATGRGLDEKRSKFYVAEIALGLSQLHLFGIVHRDLKLENVLVKRSGHIAICDFGTSKTLKRTATDGAPDRSSMGDDTPGRRDAGRQPFTRSIIGTPAYMAPEMLLEQPYNYSVDWWALGVAFFTMLRAKLPFDGGRNHEEEKMLWRIVKSRPRYDASWSPDTRARRSSTCSRSCPRRA
ncbi:serine/threonine kinase [Aureococcus anophagefferens]|nr:serine/threonine kinase [Aureococcus anophagefferens]